MAVAPSTEAASKKKKGLLGDMNERLGLGEGTDMVASRLRPMVQQSGPLGLPMGADIALEQRKASGLMGNMSDSALNATARQTGQKKSAVMGNALSGQIA